MPPAVGSEQAGARPVIVLQNDKGNRVSPVTTVVPMTTRQKHFLPTHVPVPAEETGSDFNSTAMVEQVRVIDKSRLRKRLGRISSADTMKKIGDALRRNLIL